MPDCKKCKQHFSCRYKFDGKERNVGNRKYCLTCSPFGGHNTRQLHTTNLSYYETLETVHLKCTLCGREYDYHHADTHGHTKTKCNSCLVNTRRFAVKKAAIEYKGGQCERCGYNKCVRALNFHHKDPTQKDFGISNKHCHSWERIKKELDKCMLLCSNCHMEEHERLESK